MEPQTSFCVARQTFCDAQLTRRGFRLDYHQPGQEISMLEASAKTAAFALLDYGLDQAGENGKIILTITRDWLANSNMIPVAKIKDRLILQLADDVDADPVTLSALQQIRKKGFLTAIGDFKAEDPRTALFSELDLVSVDCRGASLSELKKQHADIKRHGLTAMVSAVENWEVFEKVQAIGFDLYQGRFLGKPELQSSSATSTNRMTLIRLMTLLFDDKSSIDKIEQVIEQEPSLFYRLLKFVNSAAYRLPNKIDSLHQAVVYIGTETLCTLVAILVWAKGGHKAYTVLPQILTRAKACELLARDQGLAPADRYFTLGFLSLLDVALDQPLPELITGLSLSDEMQRALLNHEGPLADVLNFVRLWEVADWTQIEQHPMFSLERTPELMQKAQYWALDSEKALQNA